MLDQTMRRAGDNGGNDDAYDQDEPVVAEQKARRHADKHDRNGDEMQTSSQGLAVDTQIKEPKLLEVCVLRWRRGANPVTFFSRCSLHAGLRLE
jgi:hypothetical protein